jgi:hypothetical protein
MEQFDRLLEHLDWTNFSGNRQLVRYWFTAQMATLLDSGARGRTYQRDY